MKSLISDFFFGVRDLLNGISNTVWGIALLFSVLWMISHGTTTAEIGYYFAGVASTLLGIRKDEPHTQQNNFNAPVNTPGPLNTSSTAASTSTEGDKTNA